MSCASDSRARDPLSVGWTCATNSPKAAPVNTQDTERVRGTNCYSVSTQYNKLSLHDQLNGGNILSISSCRSPQCACTGTRCIAQVATSTLRIEGLQIHCPFGGHVEQELRIRSECRYIPRDGILKGSHPEKSQLVKIRYGSTSGAHQSVCEMQTRRNQLPKHARARACARCPT